MRYEYRWIEWNINQCQKHNVRPVDAQYVVGHARRPFPRRIGEGKHLVWGQSTDGDYLEVIYVIDPDGRIFIIHAMPMTNRQKQQYKRRLR